MIEDCWHICTLVNTMHTHTAQHTHTLQIKARQKPQPIVPNLLSIVTNASKSDIRRPITVCSSKSSTMGKSGRATITESIPDFVRRSNSETTLKSPSQPWRSPSTKCIHCQMLRVNTSWAQEIQACPFFQRLKLSPVSFCISAQAKQQVIKLSLDAVRLE